MPIPFSVFPVLDRFALWLAVVTLAAISVQADEIHPPLLEPPQQQAGLLVPILGMEQASVRVSVPSTKGREKVTLSAPGPWGQLEYFPVFLEAPANLIEQFPMPNSRPRWVFPQARWPELPALFKTAGLDQGFIDALLAPATVVKDMDMAYLFPPQASLEAMTPAQRQVIYAELRKYPVNEFHADPVLILSDDVDEWFHTAKIRPEIITKFKQLTYKRGQATAFSDLPVLMSYAQDEAEGKAMMKALTRTRALMVKLVANENTNVPEIMKYWTTGMNLRRKDVEPLLQSVIDVQGVDRLDLAHMLPPLPRKLLMTYPDMGMGRDGILPDCHWTSLNFFNYDPQPYLLDARLATSAVLERFNPVDAPFKFGDILFFLDTKNGDAFHSCIYIADDIVFTKNGRNVLSPWVFMKLEDVRKIYLFDDNGRVQGFRTKKATAAPAAALQ